MAKYELTPKGKEMADKLEISAKTKETMTGLQNSVKPISSVKSDIPTSESSSPIVNTLGQIYDLMVAKRELEKEKIKIDQAKKDKEAQEQENFNNLLIESLKPPKEVVKKPVEKKPKKEKKSLFSTIATGVKAVAGTAIAAATINETMKVSKEEEAKAQPSVTPVPTPTTTPQTKVEKVSDTGVIGTIKNALNEIGITNPFAQIATLANIKKESNFVSKSEDLAAYANTSNKRIREVFTTRAEKYSDDQLNEIKKDAYKFGEMVYGKDTKIGQSMGNTQEGDGYKYRGRGFIQITGKNNYKDIGQKLGLDLVSNPDLLNDPVIAAKATGVFLLNGLKNKINKFTNQGEANREITQTIGGRRLNLDAGIGAQLLSKVDKYSGEFSGPSTGVQLATASDTNKDMKEQIQREKTSQVATTNKILNVSQTQTAQASNKVDDRSPMEKKAVV